MTDEQREEKAKFVQGLRDLARFMEQHDVVKTPWNVTLSLFPENKEELAAYARVTTWKKEYSDSWFTLQKEFGPIKLEVNLSRQAVCRRVVTGKRIEPGRPATPEREVEIVEWVCDEPILAE